MLHGLASLKLKQESLVFSPTAKSPAPTPLGVSAFRELIASLTREIEGKALDDHLDDWLNQYIGVASATYQQLKAACVQGVAEGWLCKYEGAGLRYGRIFKPADDLQGFSVDVVDMKDVAGPHHVHPEGEIDLIMPLDEGARFDGRPAGWMVTPAGSAHRPTVSNGRALVLYLLPNGRIDFTASA
jgi:hypothetical protein